jgi:hypothetical protein
VPTISLQKSKSEFIYHKIPLDRPQSLDLPYRRSENL